MIDVRGHMIDNQAMHWCNQCGKFLDKNNPGERLYGGAFILCLRCARELVARLEQEAQAAQDRR